MSDPRAAANCFCARQFAGSQSVEYELLLNAFHNTIRCGDLVTCSFGCDGFTSIAWVLCHPHMVIDIKHHCSDRSVSLFF